MHSAPKRKSPSHVFREHVSRSRSLATKEGGIVHAPVAREAGIGSKPGRKQQAESVKQTYQRLSYLREQARRQGHAKEIAHYDRQLTALQPHIEAAGLIGSPSHNPFVKALGQGVNDLGTAAYGAPGAAIVSGKSVGQDVGAAGHGDFSFKRSRALAKAVALSTAQDVRHPLRHPGFTALDLFAIASAGAGTASRLGSASKALGEGEGVARSLARPGHEGGSLRHRKPAGEIDLPGGVQALEHDNPLLNILPGIGKRARVKRVTQAVEQHKPNSPLLPGKLGKEFSAQSVVGREIRAREQVQSDLGNALPTALHHRVKKLSPAENTAMRVMAVEGRAALKDPKAVIQRHIRTHVGYAQKAERRAEALAAKADGPKAAQRIARLKDRAVLNHEIAADLEKALPVLERPRKDFLQTVAAARRESRRQEGQMISAERLTKEGAAERRAKIARVYGRDSAYVERGASPGGSFYFPTGERFKFPTRSVSGGPVSRRPGETGLRQPSPGRHLMGTTKRYTGRGNETGVVQKPGEAIATRGAGLNRLDSAERFHKAVMELSSAKPRSEYDIPVAKTITPEIRRSVAAAAEHASSGDATALVRAEELLKQALHPAEGDPVRYVDSRHIKEFASSARGIPMLAKANKPFRFGGVYFRPAYVATNRPQNFLMRHLAQGITSKRPVKGTVSAIRKELGPEVSAKLDALGGQTRTAAYAPTRGIGRAERAITEGIQNVTDRDERFLAVLARAHEKGYRSIEDLTRLVADRAPKKVKNHRIAIARRTRKDMIDFSVTPGERTLSDFLYFYPYLSRGSVWAGRFLAEHPAKSAAIVQAGREAKQQGIGLPFPHPDWMKGYVASRYGLSNLNPLNTFATPAQIVDSVRHPFGSYGEEFGTPIPALASTKPSNWPKQLVQGTAPGIALQRAGLLKFLGKPGQPSKTFPHTGPKEALGPFMLGGPFPRHADASAIAKQAPSDPQAKIAAAFKQQNEHLRNLVHKGVLPHKQFGEYRKALDMLNQRDATNAEIEKRVDSQHPRKREVEKITALLDLMARNKLIAPRDAKRYQHYYSTNTKLTVKQLQKDRRWFWDDNDGKAPGPLVSWFRKSAGAND